jgi:hypothetical protein
MGVTAWSQWPKPNSAANLRSGLPPSLTTETLGQVERGISVRGGVGRRGGIRGEKVFEAFFMMERCYGAALRTPMHGRLIS